MKFPQRTAQLNFGVEPVAEPPKRAMSREELLEQLPRLKPIERGVLRFKALLGLPSNKSDFVIHLNR